MAINVALLNRLIQRVVSTSEDMRLQTLDGTAIVDEVLLEGAANMLAVPTDIEDLMLQARLRVVDLSDGYTEHHAEHLALGLAINVKDTRFGAVGDGVVDDTAAINAALVYADTLGGGTVYLPKGTYLVSQFASSDSAVLLEHDNVHIVGAGRGVTELILAANTAKHLVNIKNCSKVSIRSMSLNGNRTNQAVDSGFHALRLSAANEATADDLFIQEAIHYGIGGQAGSVHRVRLTNIDILNTGGDGIDLKNPDQDAEAIFVDNVSVRGWFKSLTLSNQKGIDIRGPALVSNVRVSEPGNNTVIGIHFNIGPSDVEATGAKNAQLTNANINMGTATAGVGLQVEAPNCRASNVEVKGGQRGILVQDAAFTLLGANVDGCSNDGVLVDDLTGRATNAMLVGVTAQNCGSRGINIQEDFATLIGCKGLNNTQQGIGIDSTADSTTIIGGRVSGNGSATLGHGGTNTNISKLRGYVNEVFQSTQVSVASTGVKTATFTHGLAATPNIADVRVNLVRDTVVDDYTVGWVRVDGATSTTITVRVNVTAASATGGATALVAMSARCQSVS